MLCLKLFIYNKVSKISTLDINYQDMSGDTQLMNKNNITDMAWYNLT